MMLGAHRRRTVLVLAGLLAACGDSSAPTPDFTIAVEAVAATTLGTQSTFDVSLTSIAFAGPVTLSVTGAPASWTVTISGGSTVNLTANGNTTATVTVTIPSNGAAAPTGQTLTVQGTA